MPLGTHHIIHVAQLIVFTLCAVKLWPRGTTYGEEEEWEHKYKHSKEARKKQERKDKRKEKLGGRSTVERGRSETPRSRTGQELEDGLVERDRYLRSAPAPQRRKEGRLVEREEYIRTTPQPEEAPPQDTRKRQRAPSENSMDYSPREPPIRGSRSKDARRNERAPSPSSESGSSDGSEEATARHRQRIYEATRRRMPANRPAPRELRSERASGRRRPRNQFLDIELPR